MSNGLLSRLGAADCALANVIPINKPANKTIDFIARRQLIVRAKLRHLGVFESPSRKISQRRKEFGITSL